MIIDEGAMCKQVRENVMYFTHQKREKAVQQRF